MLNLFKLMDVLLEIWVPGTGFILQDGSDHGGVGSYSDFDVLFPYIDVMGDILGPC